MKKRRIVSSHTKQSNIRKKEDSALKRKETFHSLIVPLLVSLITAIITGIITGYFQMKSIKEANSAQIEAAITTAEAQIKAAEITKVKQIEYDYKETNNWDVKESKYYFPLKKGNYWVYNGSFSSFSNEANDYLTKSVIVKFEIIEEFENKGLSLFIVNNFVLDIYFSTKDKFEAMDIEQLNSKQSLDFLEEKHTSGLLLVANKLFYIPNDKIESVKNFVQEPDKFVNQHIQNPSLSFEDLLLEFPLFKGQRFGEYTQISRADLSYFWYVNNVREINSLNGDTYEEVQVFDLIYNTIGAQEKLVFRPYIGILSYSFVHSGTLIEFDLNLKEFSIQ